MEKNNTTTSNFSICRKFRQVLATNLTFKTIHRMKQQNQELKPQQHIKNVDIEGGGGEGSIPITFDYSMLHNNASKVASPHVGISERKGKLATDPRLAQSERVVKVEPDDRNVNIKQGMIGKIYNGKPKVGLVNLEKQDKKSLDINDVFSEFIEREKNRIRTMSNVGKEQNNTVLDEANSFNNMENQNDHFSDFIIQAMKKIRTTSNIGKSSSLKRG